MAIYTDSQGKKRRLPSTYFYKEKGRHSYMLVYWKENIVFGEVTLSHDDPNRVPIMSHSNYSDEWLVGSCTKISFSKLPTIWQGYFRDYIEQYG